MIQKFQNKLSEAKKKLVTEVLAEEKARFELETKKRTADSLELVC